MATVGYRVYGYRKGESRTSYLGTQKADTEAEARIRILKAFPGAKITEMQAVEGESQEEKVAGKTAAIARQRELQDKRYRLRSHPKGWRSGQ